MRTKPDAISLKGELKKEYGFGFQSVPNPRKEPHRFLFGLLEVAIVSFVLLSSLSVMTEWGKRQIYHSNELMFNDLYGYALVWIGGLFLLISIGGLIWRIVLYHKYSPLPALPDEQLPSCTVIVPAYNEGRQVLLTLVSLSESDYPDNKLQIIAVDDGSVDNTWVWIKRAEKALRGRLTTIRLPCNKGKRHALYAGFQKSVGDVLVTVDSDSVVEPQTIRHLVSPFVLTRQIGAIAGNVRVLNRRDGIIPRMLDVIFVFSFDFIRAGQSVIHTVMCTPGALSAYRRSVTMKVSDEWLNQHFCGQPANIGEDRAMTNLILREGYHVLFQQDAKVYTTVPTHYQNLCKMFLRWARSNIRETLAVSRFAFRRFREGSMLGARVNIILSWVTLIRSPLFCITALALIVSHPMSFSIHTSIGIILFSSLIAGFYCFRCRSMDALWAYVYGAFWCIGLSWITPYALLTPHRSGWLTRQLEMESAPTSSHVLPEQSF